MVSVLGYAKNRGVPTELLKCNEYLEGKLSSGRSWASPELSCSRGGTIGCGVDGRIAFIVYQVCERNEPKSLCPFIICCCGCSSSSPTSLAPHLGQPRAYKGRRQSTAMDQSAIRPIRPQQIKRVIDLAADEEPEFDDPIWDQVALEVGVPPSRSSQIVGESSKGTRPPKAIVIDDEFDDPEWDEAAAQATPTTGQP